MSRFVLALLLLSISTLFVGCPPRPRPIDQPQVIFSDGAYVHEKSGMTFPIAVGDFQRGAIQRYDQEGWDISTAYGLFDARRQIAVTVYVYPAPSLVSIGSPPQTVDSARSFLAKNEFEARKREITHPRPGARLIEDTELSIPIGGTVRVGRMATFEYEEKFAGKLQAVKSHLCMFNYVGGKWALKYRITYPTHLEATREIDAVLEGVPWNVPKD
jgi:hypothetical protein